ncbi:hypothetical protein ETB97_008192 [Aspergillus alliaceus]|uniref:Uncharacterized protein n=1 Tax=Petromyces alliaceus TaxID=209559 RepID=A0A8H5ZUG5_PETAA|nr:hypothetical protein ETB97_008192 [Aspergillus burnettii]
MGVLKLRDLSPLKPDGTWRIFPSDPALLEGKARGGFIREKLNVKREVLDEDGFNGFFTCTGQAV